MKKVVSLCLAAVFGSRNFSRLWFRRYFGGEYRNCVHITNSGVSSMVFAEYAIPNQFGCAVGWNGWYTSRYGITETLFNLDKEMKAKPWLAKSCEAVDDTTWKITLKR